MCCGLDGPSAEMRAYRQSAGMIRPATWHYIPASCGMSGEGRTNDPEKVNCEECRLLYLQELAEKQKCE